MDKMRHQKYKIRFTKFQKIPLSTPLKRIIPLKEVYLMSTLNDEPEVSEAVLGMDTKRVPFS